MKKKLCIAMVFLALAIIVYGGFRHNPFQWKSDDETPRGNNYMEYSLYIDSVDSRCMG